MSATKVKKAQRPARRPECKIGPFHNGLGVAIWLNEVETANGLRYFRSNVAKLVMWRWPKNCPFRRTSPGSNAT